jgi:UDP-N-acetyl-D-mannosaminuronic acid dehydrogenase
MEVIHHIKERGLDLSAYDPHIKENKFEQQTQSLDEAVTHSDLIIVLTEHQAFKDLDPATFANKMRTKLVLDAKNCLNRKLWEQAGFEVFTLGDSKNN